MVVVLPGTVLDRAQAVESWMGSVSWCDLEIEDTRAVSLDTNAALPTYRAIARRAKDVASCRALCVSVYRMSDGRWRLLFQQQAPLSNSMGCAGQVADGGGQDDRRAFGGLVVARAVADRRGRPGHRARRRPRRAVAVHAQWARQRVVGEAEPLGGGARADRRVRRTCGRRPVPGHCHQCGHRYADVVGEPA